MDIKSCTENNLSVSFFCMACLQFKLGPIRSVFRIKVPFEYSSRFVDFFLIFSFDLLRLSLRFNLKYKRR